MLHMKPAPAAVPSAYRIEKRDCPLTSSFSAARKLEGDIFVRQSSRYAQRLEDAPEVLNSSQPFFPMCTGQW